ncbi:MAG: potassium channel family protein [Cetobacterium sp.]
MRMYQKQQILKFLKSSLITVFISILTSFIAHMITEKKVLFLPTILSSVKIFFSILPIVFLKEKNFLFKDGPLKATVLILYYLILVPIVNFSLGLHENNNLKYFFNFLSFLNVILLIVSHFILLKYVITDFLRRRRKIVASDVTVVITTYITIAISFGLLYTLLTLFNSEPAFNGIDKGLTGFEFYFKHIYFSFITITTVGYGDIYPLTTLGQFLVVVEIITGLLLTNVILGLVIGSGILTFKE